MKVKKRFGGKSQDDGKVSLVWDAVEEELSIRTVLAEIYGDTDSGRTSLAFTMPPPIAYIHTMEKHQGIIHRAISRHGAGTVKPVAIYKDFDSHVPDEVQVEASRQVARFEAFYRDSFNFARTTIIDNVTDLWQLYQLAELGTLDRAERSDSRGQLVYVGINARWSSIFGLYKRMAEDKDRELHTNLVVISKTGPEYKRKISRTSGKATGVPTGRTIRAGQKHVLTEVDVSIRTRREGDEFYAKVEKPWFNDEARGEEFTGNLRTLTMRTILGVITGEVEPWE